MPRSDLTDYGAPGGRPPIDLSPLPAADGESDDDIVALPLRHTWRWVAAGVLGLGFVWLASSLWNNENVDHATIAKFMFSDQIVHGAVLTIILTFLAMVLSTILGVVLALMRLSSNPVMSGLAWLYIWVFRGTPLLVQIVFWGYLGLLYKQISLGVPFTDFTVFAADTNTLIPAFVAGVIALTTNQAAYSAEIVRAGMLSVDPGQKEAAYSWA